MSDPTSQEKAIAKVLLQRHRAYLRGGREAAFFKALGRFLPFGVRRWLAARSAKLGLLLLNDGDIVIDKYLGEFKVHVLPNSSTEREMLAGVYERAIVDIIRRYVHSGHVCFDIGANVGALTLPMCRRAEPGGQVFCFEPGEKFFKRLLSNLALNSSIASVARPQMLGFSDSPARMNWAEDTAFPGNAWLLGETGVAVDVVTVDGFVEAHGIKRIDFMKIDVEGMEIEVLLGARATLARFRPVIVFESLLEFEAIRNRAIRKEVEDLLLGLGYEILGIADSGPQLPARYPSLPANCLALPIS